MIHYLKVLPEYFEQLMADTKTFEVRKNDRNYKVDDELTLQEWVPETGYTGKEIRRSIAYILDNPEYLKEGYVILGLDTAIRWKNLYESLSKISKQKIEQLKDTKGE